MCTITLTTSLVMEEHPGKIIIVATFVNNYCTSAFSVSLHFSKSADCERASGAACTKEWLHSQLLTKIARWSFHENLETEVKSLRLVPLDKYNQRYHDMKSRYGPYLVEVMKLS